MDYNLYPVLAGVGFIILEMFVPTQFAFFSLGVGLLVFGGTGYFIDSLIVRFILGVFSAMGVIILAIKSEKKTKKVVSNIDAIVGVKGVVVEDIEPDKLKGLVRVYGEEWNALADEFIAKGSVIEVVEVAGSRLKVKKV